MKKCLICGNSLPKRYRKFCSKECRQRYHNKKQRTYQAKWQRERNQEKREKEYKDFIPCLICGKKFRQVGTHIYYAHGLLAREYRKQFGFDLTKGQLSSDLKEIKHNHVFKNGTINNLEAGKNTRFREGQTNLGKYERSKQTLERLQENIIRLHKTKSNGRK